MRYGFLLSGEFPELARFEVLNLMETYSMPTIILEEPRILVVESEDLPQEFFLRLAMTRESVVHLAISELNELESDFLTIADKLKGKKVCVRVKRLDKSCKIRSPEVERGLGAILKSKGAEVELERPQTVVRVYISNRCHIGLLNHTTNTKQFLERRPDLRPFFRPGALKPRLGRALVNLTGIRKGTLLDPMCGTGTILIEAGLMGIDFCGMDAFQKIARGCAENLRRYGLQRNVMVGDVRKIPLKDESVSGVVTDYPYLRSSKSFGGVNGPNGPNGLSGLNGLNGLKTLYEESLFEIHRVLKRKKKAVLVSNKDIDPLLEEFNFKVEAKFEQEVHRSLVRRIYVVRKD